MAERSRPVFDATAVEAALERMAETIGATPDPCILGIQRGGADVADALTRRLEATGRTVPRGDLDISFYRDDLDTIGPHPEVRPSRIPFDINGANVWLVDDILYTGRTVRAALGEIFDYGRPATVRLACLLDRGGRELPVCPDVCGLEYAAPEGASVKLVCADEGWHIERREVRQP